MGRRTFSGSIFRVSILLLSFFLAANSVADTVVINNYNSTGTITVTTDDGLLSNVQAIHPNTINGGNETDFPVGLVYFEVSAASANVLVEFGGAEIANSTYFKYTSAFPGEEPQLRDFSQHADATASGWILHLNEGGFGDSTGNDQLIVDPGGPRLTSADQDGDGGMNGSETISVPLSPLTNLLMSLFILLWVGYRLKRIRGDV